MSDAATASAPVFVFDPRLLSEQVIGADAAGQELRHPSGVTGDVTWRESGNLRGSVPVFSEEDPPDINVVEDAVLFFQLQLAVTSAAADQQKVLDRFMVDGQLIDQRYWFAKSYYLVTVKLLTDVMAAKFNYPSFVLLSILYFKKAYIDNLAHWDTDKGCEAQWQVAFGYSQAEIGRKLNDNIPALSHSPPDKGQGGAIDALVNVMRSAEAHLRFDLCRCVAWTFTTHYPSDIIDLSVFKDDFFNMAELFDQVTGAMQAEISTYTGALFTNFPTEWGRLNLVDLAAEMVSGHTLDAEREATWDRAVALVDEFGASMFNPFSLIFDPPGAAIQFLALVGDVMSTDNLRWFKGITDQPDMEASSLFEPILDLISGVE